MKQDRPPSLEEIAALTFSEPSEAVALAKRYGKLYEPVAVAGILIDAGGAARDPSAIRSGLAILKKVGRRSGATEETLYFEGNAYVELAEATVPKPAADDWPARGRWLESTHDSRRKSRVAFSNSGALGLGPNGQQAMINLGNDLHHSGRHIEAFDCWAVALPHPVAAGWAADALYKSASLNPGVADQLYRRANELALQAQSSPEVVAASVGDGLVEYFASFPTDTNVSNPSLLDDLGPYDRFVALNRLHLGIAAEGISPEYWDYLRAPVVLHDVEDGEPSPELYAMVNICKSEYLAARRLVFSAMDQQEDRDADLYTDTLDYAVYGERLARLSIGLRAALDILDKVAFAFNAHFAVGLDDAEASFRNLWRDPDSLQLRSVVWDEIAAGNPSVVGLVDLATDLYRGGWLAGSRNLRNIATHRFIVLHDLMVPSQSGTSAIVRMLDSEMHDVAVSGLRTARSALNYFVEAVERRSVRLGEGVEAVQIVYPSHGEIRGVQSTATDR